MPITLKRARQRPTIIEKPVRIALTSFKCIEETDEVGADTPYFLVTAADLTTTFPSVEVTRYGPQEDVDTGEAFVTGGQFFWWTDNRSARLISDPDDVIFVVSAVENDDGDPAATTALVKVAAVSSLAASRSASRPARAAALIRDIRGALQVPTGAPNFDDEIQTRELRFEKKDLLVGGTGNAPIHRDLDVVGDGGHYKLWFTITGG